MPIRFGSWMGGDRDGNPNVTGQITQRVLRMCRWIAADLYWRELDALRAELSMGTASDELRAVVGDVEEPYRAFLRGVKDMERPGIGHRPFLREKRRRREIPSRIPCERTCCSANAPGGDRSRVGGRRKALYFDPTFLFGLTLVKLDIRQESTVHEAVAAHVCSLRGDGLCNGRRRSALRHLQNRLADSETGPFSDEGADPRCLRDRNDPDDCE